MEGKHSSYWMASLYVGNLHSDVTEAMLYKKFSPAGPLLSICVCRDRITRHALGYAYVTFQRPADAKRALDSMNFDVIQGKPIRIMWSQQDPSVRKSNIGNIFIEDLDKSIDNKALYDTFSAFGDILSCKVVRDENNSKSYAFVHFETQEAANRALEKIYNVHQLDHKGSFCSLESQKEREAESGAKAREFTSVYIKNFGDNMDNKRLRELFVKYGEIRSVKVMTHPNGKSKGFGFVNFAKPEDANKAVKEMNGKEINRKKVFVGPAQKREERQAELKRQLEQLMQEKSHPPGSTLYIQDLDETADDKKLTKVFSPFGTIVSAEVRVGNGQSEILGVVHFSSPKEAIKAKTEMNGQILGSKLLRVTLEKRTEKPQTQLTTLGKRKKKPQTQLTALEKRKEVPQTQVTNQDPPPTAKMEDPSTKPIIQQSLPAAGGNFMPAVPQIQSRPTFCAPNQMTQMRPNPCWQQGTAPQISQRMPNAMHQPGPGSSVCHLPPAGDAQGSCNLPNPTQRVGVINTAPNLAPWPPVPVQAPSLFPPYTYTLNVCHPRPSVQPFQIPQPFVHLQGQGPLAASMLAAVPPAMLLEINNPELLRMVVSPELLHSKVEEAVTGVPGQEISCLESQHPCC